ncbi:PPC domain-containing DNA-binding protein [uncultured Shewanella sp.]|uniref:PPC domain-containing DNA-binding protein n=1 Tax=uncultured Shewanella sp. TaxID=173975 RepID=UPI00261A50F4|nr:PPC domain-containing DNA-binding protein [uncultured Shewanella sp.]
MIFPLAFRLTQGIDLKLAIQKIVKENHIRAGNIASCVGSLSTLKIRLAGATNTLTLQEPLEIISIMGTLTLEHAHIHLCVANQKGEAFGGHLLEGSIIDTTGELIVHYYPELNFVRKYDHNTGFTELSIDAN